MKFFIKKKIGEIIPNPALSSSSSSIPPPSLPFCFPPPYPPSFLFPPPFPAKKKEKKLEKENKHKKIKKTKSRLAIVAQWLSIERGSTCPG